MSQKDDFETGSPRCDNCGSTDVRSVSPMPGDYAGDVVELECAGCGYPRGLIQ